MEEFPDASDTFYLLQGEALKRQLAEIGYDEGALGQLPATVSMFQEFGLQ